MADRVRGHGSDASAAAQPLLGYWCSQMKREGQLPWYPAAPFSPAPIYASENIKVILRVRRQIEIRKPLDSLNAPNRPSGAAAQLSQT